MAMNMNLPQSIKGSSPGAIEDPLGRRGRCTLNKAKLNFLPWCRLKRRVPALVPFWSLDQGSTQRASSLTAHVFLRLSYALSL
ncbi:hypothetical protein TNCV_1377061 [Trichonephila clavipes]|nr:hypothetical protein TNCV_1377061 [Trichonephila clavipes]